MAQRASFLTERYGAYYHREVPTEDAELTHVGPGTPCGEWLRRFWIPVAYLQDLKDLPQRVLGEDLVVFRDRFGRIELLELHRAHRGTSLEFGIIADRGIRCCYQSWQYDVDGTILDTSGEGADSTLKDRRRPRQRPRRTGSFYAKLADERVRVYANNARLSRPPRRRNHQVLTSGIVDRHSSPISGAGLGRASSGYETEN